MTPERVKELAATVRGRLAGQRWNEGDAALTALTDGLLSLLAERAGMAGTPALEGWYVCRVAMDATPRIMLFATDRTWAHRDGPFVTRFWRLPGEVYTPISA